MAWLTAAQAGRDWGVSRSTVLRWCRARLVRCRYAGLRWTVAPGQAKPTDHRVRHGRYVGQRAGHPKRRAAE